MAKKYLIKNLDQLPEVFIQNQHLLQERTLFLFRGELGAGKTTFIRSWLESLGIENVQSPTYAFHLSYSWKQFQISHFDLYRLETEEDLESIGFWDFFSSENHILFIEWSEKIKNSDWPLDWKKIIIQISKLNEVEREIEIKTEALEEN